VTAFVGGTHRAAVLGRVHSDSPRRCRFWLYLSAFICWLGLGVIFGVLWCLRQRIHEIQKEEKRMKLRKY
jgi:hypothetical protein